MRSTSTSRSTSASWRIRHQTRSSHIISKDTGFDPLINHLKSRKILASRSESVLELPILKALKYRSPEDRAEVVMARLRLPKATHPTKTNTLSNGISREFHGQLTDTEVAAVLTAMLARGFVAAKDGKL